MSHDSTSSPSTSFIFNQAVQFPNNDLHAVQEIELLCALLTDTQNERDGLKTKIIEMEIKVEDLLSVVEELEAPWVKLPQRSADVNHYLQKLEANIYVRQ
jgi:hypothetical protein